MDRVTVYLPPALRVAVKRATRRRGVSQAEVIRQAIKAALADERPHPKGGLFAGGAPIARDADPHLAGFGR